MGDGFNPYSEWLAIECAGRPDHYALLGLSRFEADPQRVALAADQRIAQLRKTASQERLALAKSLAQEILGARNCLLSAADRATYDAQIRREHAAKKPTAPAGISLPPRAFDEDDDEPIEEDAPLEGIALPSELPPPPPAKLAAPPLVALPIAAASPLAEASIVVRQPVAVTPRKPMARLPLLIAGATMGLIGVSGAVMLPYWLKPATPQTAQNPMPLDEQVAAANSSPPSDDSADDSEPASELLPIEEPPENVATEVTAPYSEGEVTAPADEEMTSPPDEMEPAEMETPSDPAPSETMPATGDADVAATRTTLAAARKAMGKGDVEAAADQVDLADLEAIDAVSAEMVAHDRAVLEYLKGFWRAVDEGFTQLSAGTEFEREGRTVVVVERTPQRLIIREGGRNRAYDRMRLPAPLAVFLAQRWLKPDDANTPLFVAAFHLLDADGDRAEARKLLDAAKSAGTAGAEDLLRELEN
ncbi:MAG: hypothetical protein SGJ19_16565 [Planctomycetia bacterium]|nr:hypothetical protein [Planctomycetia bacterium]